MERIGNILFVIAGCLWGIELIPQLVKTFKSKSVGDFSPFFLTLCIIAYTLFMTGCVMIKNWYLLFSHIIPSINLVILCILYGLYRKNKIQHFPPDSETHVAYIVDGKCENNGRYICNLGYACDGCPYNKETK